MIVHCTTYESYTLYLLEGRPDRATRPDGDLSHTTSDQQSHPRSQQAITTWSRLTEPMSTPCPHFPGPDANTPCFCCRRLVDTNTGRFSCHHGLRHRSSSRCAPRLWPLWASGSHPSTVRQEYHRLPRLPFAIRGTPDCGCCYALFPNPALPPPPVLCLPAHLVRIFSLLSGLRPMHSHKGTSQAMLVVAYTMWVNGNVVGIGLGRRVN